MKDKFYNAIQTFSSAIIKPVMFMAVTGILIAVAAIFQLEIMPEFLKVLGEFMNTVLVSGVIGQLAVIFAVGIATALAKDKKTDAAIMGISTFMIFLFANNFWLNYTGRLAEAGEFGLAGTGQGMILGIQATDMGVFLGIILGCIVGYIHNKFKDLKFHEYLSVYDGTKFAFLILIIIASILGVAVTYVWPPINTMISNVVQWFSTTGSFGFFAYGVVNRVALPFGLHHLLWMPIYYTPLGGTAEIAGESVSGALNIWLAEISNISTIEAMHPSVGYLANFGYLALPVGIAVALIGTAKKENRKKVATIVIPAVISAAVAGITEPIEFIFLFTAPVLWIAHALIYGFGLWLSSILGLDVYVGHLIETILYSIVVPLDIGRQWLIPIVFIVLVAIEYIVFKFLIEKLDLNTLGRKEDLNDEIEYEDIKEESRHRKTMKRSSQIGFIIEGLGGKENISHVNNCYSRLRIDVSNPDKIDEETLEKYPSSGVIIRNKHVQIIVGTGVGHVREELERTLETSS